MATEQRAFLDNDNYLRCSAPFATADEANAALQAFWDGVYELRNKHRISDVLLVFRLQVMDTDGKATERFGSLMAGNELYAEPLAAWSFGRASADRQQLIGRLATQSANDGGGMVLPQQSPRKKK